MKNQVIYNDFDKLIKSISDHKKNCGGTIVSFDVPEQLLLGWICKDTKEQWQMDVYKVTQQKGWTYLFTSEQGRTIWANDVI